MQSSTSFLPWLSSADPTSEPSSVSTSDVEETSEGTEDFVHNYACSLLFLGMLVKYYEDAIKEGDANREEKFWKNSHAYFQSKNQQPIQQSEVCQAIQVSGPNKGSLASTTCHEAEMGTVCQFKRRSK